MNFDSGRLLTMGQSKQGLVVVNMEEMPSNRTKANPNQLQTSRLICQRFSGRKGGYNGEGCAPRNSTKRSISGDASIICLFTSNYELEKPCLDALGQLGMFSNLRVVEMEAATGKTRTDLATACLRQSILDRLPELHPLCSIHVDLPPRTGDTRPLVKLIRMAAFFVCALCSGKKVNKSTSVLVSQKGDSCRVEVGADSMDLRVTTLGNLVPRTRTVFDRRSVGVVQTLNRPIGIPTDELSIVVDFWLAKALSPAVVVSTNRDSISSLIVSLGQLNDVCCISDIDASEYKMTKSLYDPSDTPNLRDDILKFGQGAFVAIELLCKTSDAQACVREIIEDTPSMTAFSTEKSALKKKGLFFCVHTHTITPEIKSRASLIL